MSCGVCRRMVEARRNSPDLKSGSSSSSLARKNVFGGPRASFHRLFQFRSTLGELNTELGFVIDSPALAQEIENAFDRQDFRQYLRSTAVG